MHLQPNGFTGMDGKTYTSLLDAVRFGTFQVVSVISTTGYATADNHINHNKTHNSNNYFIRYRVSIKTHCKNTFWMYERFYIYYCLFNHFLVLIKTVRGNFKSIINDSEIKFFTFYIYYCLFNHNNMADNFYTTACRAR